MVVLDSVGFRTSLLRWFDGEIIRNLEDDGLRGFEACKARTLRLLRAYFSACGARSIGAGRERIRCGPKDFRGEA